MNLSAKKRAKETKAEISKIRREGNIPAVLYSAKRPAEAIEVNGEEFRAALRAIRQGRLATTVFNVEIDGKTVKAIVKDIQYAVTSYRILHIDLCVLEEDTPVRVKVPIECVGVEDCVGIKQGGALRRIIRSLPVECLPKDIPQEFFLDVKELGMKQSKKLSALDLPKGVRSLVMTDEVVAVIAKR